MRIPETIERHSHNPFVAWRWIAEWQVPSTQNFECLTTTWDRRHRYEAEAEAGFTAAIPANSVTAALVAVTAVAFCDGGMVPLPLQLSAQLLFCGLIVQLNCQHVLKMLLLSLLLCSIFFSPLLSRTKWALSETTCYLAAITVIASVIFITKAEMFMTDLLGQKLWLPSHLLFILFYICVVVCATTLCWSKHILNLYILRFYLGMYKGAIASVTSVASLPMFRVCPCCQTEGLNGDHLVS